MINKEKELLIKGSENFFIQLRPKLEFQKRKQNIYSLAKERIHANEWKMYTQDDTASLKIYAKARMPITT